MAFEFRIRFCEFESKKRLNITYIYLKTLSMT